MVEATPTTGLGERPEIMVEKLAAWPRERQRGVIGGVDDVRLHDIKWAMVLGFGARWGVACVNLHATSA